MAGYTPMMQQYLRIKADYKDAFLFFRLGDFYEMFFDDALKATKELEITLTSKNAGVEEKVPMCGVPYHSADNYIRTLVSRGYKVAICEQVEDPKTAKGVVKREVVQLITPGTVMENGMLDEKENNYLAAVHENNDRTHSLVYHDLSTGENRAALLEGGFDSLLSELYNQPVREIVISEELDQQRQEALQVRLGVTLSYQDSSSTSASLEKLTGDVTDARLLDCFSMLLNYVERTQKRGLDHLKPLQVMELKHFMTLDMYSKRNLELTETILKKGKHGSLLWVLDDTVTAMGARMLKKWLERPLLQKEAITKRQDLVQAFFDHFFERDTIRQHLQSVYDIERLSGRVAFGNVNARDLLQLKRTLEKLPELKQVLSGFEEEEVQRMGRELNPLPELSEYLEKSLHEDAPIGIRDGDILKDGFHEQLDTYRDASRNGKQWIAALEQREREETGIKSLKVGFNKVFGYYIEVTRANLQLLPEGKYERKQTLSNAERFITPELKEKEALILEAQEKSVELEYNLFMEIRDHVKTYIPALQLLADQISQLDVLQSFAEVSEKQRYARPTFNIDRSVAITEGRHPVIEKVMKTGQFVPNDVKMGNDADILLITGPNMSGKSTYMRQVALTSIMAQIGCFVPCEAADLPLFDQIFTRIGAADDLVSGQSTFMVEMLESRHALEHATDRSLILLDEIGRGTSTYDGMALAQAIIEYVHNNIHAKTLFSTHYHELTSLDENLDKLRNIHVRAEEHDGNVVFLHQIREGAADESYGIHVAKLAKLPESLIQRASHILHELEGQGEKPSVSKPAMQVEDDIQLSFFSEPEPEKKKTKQDNKADKVIAELASINLMEQTPLEAMNLLYKLQQMATKK
ncbi:DNA mismatch repair protein MutS [Terribacillus saccharophilus]|uniref:DNA mismatch repair protein MutS n=1 Tax=Terribacillus saccharophilus TaxID=361277 RepID=A0A268HCL9_9BACI|nr:DNA mismatch repair protein MutS [Terribacillus saccharophilus]PAE07637.1 DNA mismatch repair protein MutS [Terribacillus saccharophilus]